MSEATSRAEATGQLAALLADAFTAAELRRFVARLPDGEALLDDLPGEIASLNTLAHALVDLLTRRRQLDGSLLAALAEAAPRRVEELGRIAAGLGLPPPQAPPRASLVQTRPRPVAAFVGVGVGAGALGLWLVTRAPEAALEAQPAAGSTGVDEGREVSSPPGAWLAAAGFVAVAKGLPAAPDGMRLALEDVRRGADAGTISLRFTVLNDGAYDLTLTDLRVIEYDRDEVVRAVGIPKPAGAAPRARVAVSPTAPYVSQDLLLNAPASGQLPVRLDVTPEAQLREAVLGVVAVGRDAQGARWLLRSDRLALWRKAAGHGLLFDAATADAALVPLPSEASPTPEPPRTPREELLAALARHASLAAGETPPQ